jgi:hypothetical protein
VSNPIDSEIVLEGGQSLTSIVIMGEVSIIFVLAVNYILKVIVVIFYVSITIFLQLMSVAVSQPTSVV